MRARLNPTRGEEFKYTSFATYTPPHLPFYIPQLMHRTVGTESLQSMHEKFVICCQLGASRRGQQSETSSFSACSFSSSSSSSTRSRASRRIPPPPLHTTTTHTHTHTHTGHHHQDVKRTARTRRVRHTPMTGVNKERVAVARGMHSSRYSYEDKASATSEKARSSLQRRQKERSAARNSEGSHLTPAAGAIGVILHLCINLTLQCTWIEGQLQCSTSDTLVLPINCINNSLVFLYALSPARSIVQRRADSDS